jgi:putative aldouronate transport system permease protein
MLFDIRSPWQDKVFDVLNLIVLILIFFITAYPLYFVLIASVSDPVYVNVGEVFFAPRGWSLRGYELVARDPRILLGYRNTIIYTLCGTLLSVAITVCAGYALSRKDLYGKTFFTLFFLFTMYFNGGLIPTYLQVRNLGLVNTFGVVIIVGSLSIWNLIVCRTFFRNTIPDELWEAASIDGSGTIGFFLKIVIPNSRAIIAIMSLYYAVGQWNDYFKALVYLSKSKLYPLQLILRDLLLSSQTLAVEADPTMLVEITKQAEALKYAMIVVASFPVLALYPLAQKYFVRGIMVGSVKG